MKLRLIKLFSLLFVIFLFGCTTVMKSLLGIKNPQLESSRSLKEFAVKCSINSDQLFHIDSLYGYAGFKYFLRAGLPGLRIYNQRGDLVKILKSEDCPHKLSSTIKS